MDLISHFVIRRRLVRLYPYVCLSINFCTDWLIFMKLRMDVRDRLSITRFILSFPQWRLNKFGSPSITCLCPPAWTPQLKRTASSSDRVCCYFNSTTHNVGARTATVQHNQCLPGSVQVNERRFAISLFLHTIPALCCPSVRFRALGIKWMTHAVSVWPHSSCA
jgi:hypothetical protein